MGLVWGEFWRRDGARGATELAQLVSWLCEQRLRPLVTERYPLEHAAAALAAIYGRKVTGKLLITI
jgi:NADPH2:quinone reductase